MDAGRRANGRSAAHRRLAVAGASQAPATAASSPVITTPTVTPLVTGGAAARRPWHRGTRRRWLDPDRVPDGLRLDEGRRRWMPGSSVKSSSARAKTRLTLSAAARWRGARSDAVDAARSIAFTSRWLASQAAGRMKPGPRSRHRPADPNMPSASETAERGSLEVARACCMQTGARARSRTPRAGSRCSTIATAVHSGSEPLKYGPAIGFDEYRDLRDSSAPPAYQTIRSMDSSTRRSAWDSPSPSAAPTSAANCSRRRGRLGGAVDPPVRGCTRCAPVSGTAASRASLRDAWARLGEQLTGRVVTGVRATGLGARKPRSRACLAHPDPPGQWARYASRPWRPPSRPKPDLLVAPNGDAGWKSVNVFAQTTPARSRFAIQEVSPRPGCHGGRRCCSPSRRPRPACGTSGTDGAGPKISSRAMRCDAEKLIVGGNQNPRAAAAPAATSAPRLGLSRVAQLADPRWAAELIAPMSVFLSSGSGSVAMRFLSSARRREPAHGASPEKRSVDNMDSVSGASWTQCWSPPPSSRLSRVSCPRCAVISLPSSVEPVSAILSTSKIHDRRHAGDDLGERQRRRRRRRLGRLQHQVLPVASAGAIFHAAISSGNPRG